MKHGQTGFTLIELVVVILIVGILAAVAVPRFVSLTDEASDAANRGNSGAFSAGYTLIKSKALVNNVITGKAYGTGNDFNTDDGSTTAGQNVGVTSAGSIVGDETNTAGFIADNADCVAVWTEIMDSAGPSVKASDGATTNDDADYIAFANAGTDGASSGAVGSCVYHYTLDGGFTDGAPPTSQRSITYTPDHATTPTVDVINPP